MGYDTWTNEEGVEIIKELDNLRKENVELKERLKGLKTAYDILRKTHDKCLSDKEPE